MDIRVGDVLVLKKNHPCGACRWEVMGARTKYEKQIKKIERAEPPENDGKSGN